MISCIFTVYNEEARLGLALRGARTWADEIIVGDKGSTDRTIEIAREYGAKIVSLPFSMNGDDDPLVLTYHSKNDWILSLTPSDQPTPGMITTIKNLINTVPQSTDIIQVPVKMYTFGDFVFRSEGPWSISYQSKLINRKTVRPLKKVHVHFQLTPKSIRVPFSEDAHIVHCTHPSFAAFMNSHVNYAKVEAKEAESPRQRAAEALAKADRFDDAFRRDGERSLKQWLAWKTYHYMIAIACLEKAQARAVGAEYQELLQAMVQTLEDRFSGTDAL